MLAPHPSVPDIILIVMAALLAPLRRRGERASEKDSGKPFSGSAGRTKSPL